MTTVHVGEPPIHPMVAPYANAPTVALDTETSSLYWWENTFWIGGYVLYAPGIGSTYIPVGHETMFDINEDKLHVASSIQRLADDPKRRWLMHNRVFDENVVNTAGITFKGEITDTIGLWWTISSFFRSYALKQLGNLVDPVAAAEETKLGDFIRGNKLKRYTQVPVEIMRPYAEQDGILTYKLWEEGLRRLPAHQTEVHEMEQQWIGLLSRMTRVGLPADVELCQEIIDSSLSKAHQVRLKLAKMTGIRGFNPGAAAQVQKAAAKFGVKLLNDSTEMASLWASNFPKEMRDGIIEYRQLVHSVGSYFEPFISIARNARDKRVHTTFRTTTSTGRLAAGDPINLQGLPRNSDTGRHRVREVVRYQEESGLGRAYLDFAQIDVRLGTHYSQDKLMTQVLTDPEGDVHTMVMNEIRAMNVNIDRPNSKRLVFGSQYMVGPDKFSATASGLDEDGEYQAISRETADKWLKAHRKRFPAFPWINQQVEAVMKQRGHIWLWDGKWVVFPEEEDPFKGFAHLVQAGGAQIIKRAMVAADKELRAGGYASVLALQVHDEVHVEGPLEELPVAANLTAFKMAYIWPDCRIPLYVQPELGAPSWAKKTHLGERVPLNEERWRIDSRRLAAV